MMRSAVRLAVTGLVVLATLTPASALAGPVAASNDDRDDDSGRLMLVMDSSGSMKEKADGGQTKIAAAKSSLDTVIDGLPDGQPVGLRVYGAEVFSADDKGACTDSQRVVDLDTDNRDALRSAVADYKPYGETPIGYALQQAGKDLGNEGQRTIVLVSDGEPTCEPDPCDVAEKLSQDGIDLHIDVVGLDVDGQARSKLQCIADAGNGSYYDADDSESLTRSLDTLSTRAFRPFDLTGEPVEGTATPTGAPRIRTGQYVDTIPASGDLNYRIKRTVPGSTIHLGVTVEGEAGSSGMGIRAAIRAGQGADATDCNYALVFGNGIGRRHPYLFGGTSTWASAPDSPCNTATTVNARLENIDEEFAGTPVEIAVYEEPPLADARGTDLPPAAEPPTWSTLQQADEPVKGVVPGTSIANAPVLKDGTYALDITGTESQVFAVPIDWGQNVQAQLDARLNDTIRDAGAVGSDVQVHVLGPVRTEPEVDFYGSEPEDWTTRAFGNLGPDDPTFRTGAQSLTPTYLNRTSNEVHQVGADLAGLHYVQVSFNVTEEVTMPYTLTIKTNGTAEDAPTYRKVDGLAAPAADSRLVAAPDPKDDDSPRTAADESGDDLPLVPIGLGTTGVVALAAAGLLFWRSRRSTE